MQISLALGPASAYIIDVARQAGYQANLDGCFRCAPPLADEAIEEWLAGWDAAQVIRDQWDQLNTFVEEERVARWGSDELVTIRPGSVLWRD